MMLFNQLALLTENISTAIRYNSNDIYNLLSNECKYTEIPFMKKVLDNLEQGNSVEYSWKNAVDLLPASYGLSKQDKTTIKQFGCKLGVTDVEGQSNHCEYFKSVFSMLEKQLKEDYIKRSRVYRSLGFFSGLALSIMIF